MPAVIEFVSVDSDEAEAAFQEWRVANRQQGYILNADEHVLHKAGCRHFGGKLKVYTALPKICFENRAARVGWDDERKFTEETCRTCSPRPVLRTT